MIGQKEAVIKEIEKLGYRTSSPNPVELTREDFQKVEDAVFNGIIDLKVKYGKDLASETTHDTRLYVRSMIKNHLRKAKELNGSNCVPTPSTKQAFALDRSTLPEFVDKSLSDFLGENSGTQE